MDSPTEMLIVFAVALVLLGPGRVPRLARSLGEAIREFRSASRGDGSDDTAEDADPPAVTDPAPSDPIDDVLPG